MNISKKFLLACLFPSLSFGSVVAAEPASDDWVAAADGSWDEAAKWSDGTVPSGARPVQVTAEGADYSVSVPGDITVPKITLGNEEGFRTKLAVSEDVTISAEMLLKSGGVYEQTAGLVTVASDLKPIVLEDGAVWRVTGGTCTPKLNAANRNQLRVNSGGRIEVSGGRLSLKNDGPEYITPLDLAGGEVRVSGTGCLDMRVTGESVLGDGTIDASEDAEISFYRSVFSAANGHIRFTTSGNAYFHVESGIYMGFNSANYDDLLDLGSSCEAKLGWEVGIGLNFPGRGRVQVREGAKACLGNGYGLMVGSCNQTKKIMSTCFPTGIVTIAGIARTSAHFFNSNADGPQFLRGVEIGGVYRPLASDGISCGSATQYWPVGVFSVERTGSYSLDTGFFAVGHGFGEGTVNVAGTCEINGDACVMVGAGEGVGRFNVTDGGMMTVTKDVYVGSFVTNVTANWKFPRYWEFYPNDAKTSRGRISVLDGAFAATNGLVRHAAVFGTHGTGELEIGEKGSFIAGEVTFGNDVGSTLSFVLGRESAGLLEAETLTVHPGARLVIDASAYEGTSSVPLVKADFWNGAFAVSDITVLPAQSRGRVALQGNVLRFHPNRGLTIVFR